MAADVKARFTQRLRAAVDQFPVTNGPRRHAQEARSNLIETVSLQLPARRFLQPSPDCESPRLWLLVSGHFRTFHWTQMDMAEMARRSSHGCYLAVAVMPQEICALNGSHASASCLPPGRGAAVDTRDPLLEWRDFAPSSHSVPSLLETASRRAFHGRLGFAVIRRGRDVSGYPRGVWTLWRACWELCKFIIDTSDRLVPRPESVVIRARPDTHFTAAVELYSLSHYFLHGERGRHLILGQHTWDAPSTPDLPQMQGDLLLITSFGCYYSDIGETTRWIHPFEAQKLGRLFLANSWGIGWSLAPAFVPFLAWNTVSAETLSGVPLVDGGRLCTCLSLTSESGPSNESLPMRVAAGAWPASTAERSACRGAPYSCLATVVESPWIVTTAASARAEARRQGTCNAVGYLLRAAPPIEGLRRPCWNTMVELTSGVHLYCPWQRARDRGSERGRDLLTVVRMPWWDRSRRFFRAVEPSSLKVDGTSPWENRDC